jgi:hypothetical protein
MRVLSTFKTWLALSIAVLTALTPGLGKAAAVRSSTPFIKSWFFSEPAR